MQPTNYPADMTRAVYHSGPSPTPDTTYHCTAVQCVAGKTFFNLQALDGILATVEHASGCMLVKGGVYRCTRRSGTYITLKAEHDTPNAAPMTSKLDQVLALCAELGYIEAYSGN
ncbi:unnamed protein product [Peniophora sp. CBMAI 1063]|nr:unnamed protein product [Peniophora sp. CBMAI 1063]